MSCQLVFDQLFAFEYFQNYSDHKSITTKIGRFGLTGMNVMMGGGGGGGGGVK